MCCEYCKSRKQQLKKFRAVAACKTDYFRSIHVYNAHTRLLFWLQGIHSVVIYRSQTLYQDNTQA